MQVAMRRVHLQRPGTPPRGPGGSRRGSRRATFAMSSASIARGAGASGVCGRALGPSVCQPPSPWAGSGASPPRGCYGTPCARHGRAGSSAPRRGPRHGRRSGQARRAGASFQRPRQFGVIRPSGETCVASTQRRPTPPAARAARWPKCQSLGMPSSAEYWHIGDIMIRLRGRPHRGSGSGGRGTGRGNDGGCGARFRS
jgi:hypothetical protein